MFTIARFWSAALLAGVVACNQGSEPKEQNNATADTAVVGGGQENVKDNESAKDIVKIAVGSKDHTTLVAALKKANLITSLSNAGPFTVFAPTNEAFNKLPPGTLDGLMKDDRKDDLANILQYHVALGVLKLENLQDGQVLGMVNGDNATVSTKGGKITLNNAAQVIATIPASNGVVYVVDGVLLPPAKK